jgi:predicted metal-dependent enzyme (double-stranded beta helix superfamily)
MAELIDASSCPGRSEEYARCALHEDPTGWSLAAIVLRPGQSTPSHDHGGWGGAVTVQGVERDRRFASDAADELSIVAEGDYPPGTGYLFDPDDVHQPIGVDTENVTVALHFLAPTDDSYEQHNHEDLEAGVSAQ